MFPQTMCCVLGMTRVTLLLILLVHFGLTISLSEGPGHYTVTPSSADPCNETEHCLTLSQFVNNSSDCLRANITLHFLQGEHSLDSTLLIENVDTFYMSSLDSNVTIVCNHSSARFEFNNVSVVHVSGLTFTGCTGNKFINIRQLMLKDSQLIGHEQINGIALELEETSATFTNTKLRLNYGSRVTSLTCENDDHANVRFDFLNGRNRYEDITVDVTAGGAIASTHSNVTIIDSVFEGNSAQAGGAIFAQLQSNITIINSTFVGNQATSLQSHQYCYAGGGVLYCDSGSSIIVNSSTFERNTAHWLGGVMTTGLHGTVTITITNSDFVSNTAGYLGGVLSSADNSSITITNSNFTENSANSDGGVLYISPADYSSITITNSNFTENSANSDGGVLYMSPADYSSITITNSNFTENSANHGGVLRMSSVDSSITITNSNFTENSANHGGVLGMSSVDSSITITNSNFTENSANHGGVLHMSPVDHSSITITNSNFTENSANHGGVLHMFSVDSSITITNSNFTENSANHGGVLGMFSVNSSITITNSNFTENSANYHGGVLVMFLAVYSSITITNSNFTENSASYGGVLHMSDEFGFYSEIYNIIIITITNSNFTENSANFSGGVLGMSYVFYSNITITITNSNFTENSANRDGGVLDMSGADHSSITISKSEFIGNRAQRLGGAIILYTYRYRQSSTITISYCNFTYNMASQGGVMNTRYTDVTITQSAFEDNEAVNNGGTMHIQGRTLTINCSQFHHNMANFGGVLWAQQADIHSHDTNVSNNIANIDGGVLYTQQSTAVITGANLSHNRADNNGGTMYITDRATTSIVYCIFNHNMAGNDGGVIRSYLSNINISESECSSNIANNEGGVFSIDQTNLIIDQTSFTDSTARAGGVIWTDQGVLTINHSYFSDNNASAGGVMWAEQATVNADTVSITCNHANVGIVYLIESTSDWSDFMYSDNVGSLYAIGGAITIGNNSNLTNNTQPNHATVTSLKEGGAITAIQSEIKFDGNSSLTKGRAESGGALKATDSRVHIHGNVVLSNNVVTEAGGGIYLYHSELTCWKSSALNIRNNMATEKGGGINAIGSVIKVKNPLLSQTFSSLHIDSNKAMIGGGIFLEMDTKIYILKSIFKVNTSKLMTGHQRIISFSLNSAQYGGAIYMSDNGMCSLSTKSTVNECFIQTLAMYGPMSADIDSDDTRCQNIDFINNTAMQSGNSLFGGLLDRCSVSQFAEVNINNVNMDYTISNGTMIVEGHEYFQKISNIQDIDIGSHPVRVCFCTNGQPNCLYQHDPIQVRKGQLRNISLSLAVVNQNNNPLQEQTINSQFISGNYYCQSLSQSMDGNCSKISFGVSSNNDTEELVLSLPEGPCKDAPESKARVILEFTCPQCVVGFKLDESEEGCQCVCDSQLFPYFTNCSGEILVRERNVWVTSLATRNTSNTNQYLIHPYCPFDYCHPPSSRVEINLNILNGADSQCANNRAGLLCGTCQHNFSLSPGSSQCLPCSTHWLVILIAILIAAILAGILLVALLLALNLTVAIGTINGIIFYANIVYANNSVFFPFTKPTSITAFISWLNLDIGFDTCFFVGMDAYSKTLLQLAFPGYVFFLVFMVIIISKYSMRFSKLIGKRNPVATLATLISLSYAKLLHITIASLSYAILKYPDGSHTYVWLIDASVNYLSGKHIVVFMIALLIIIAGVCYTTLLLFWQWLLRHQDKTMFRWTKYQKLCHFIEPYHAPYTVKHRYWAGLLFLVRVVLYIVFALNVNGDPDVNLVAIILTIGGLLLIKGLLIKVYKKWPIDVIESIMYFNILGFAALTSYFNEAPEKQAAIAYTSVTITLLLLLMVIAFHVYKFTILGYIIQKTKIFKIFKEVAANLLDNEKAKETTDIYVNKNSAQHEQEQQEVSFSVVEIPKPILECAEPEVHIELKSQELPCYTPENSLEQQESEIQELDNK